jgi:hypothetical protein
VKNNRSTWRTASVLVVVVALGMCSCFWGDDEDKVNNGGVVQFLEIEGGCWRIAGDDGVNYEPINLAEEFKEDGLAVLFEATPRKDLSSTCMVGQIVEITSMRRKPADQ